MAQVGLVDRTVTPQREWQLPANHKGVGGAMGGPGREGGGETERKNRPWLLFEFVQQNELIKSYLEIL